MQRARTDVRSRVTAAGITFFGVVLAAGFVLGLGRTLVVAPVIGTVPAELAEYPVMLAIVVLAGRWRTRVHRIPSRRARLAAGALAAGCMIVAEQGLIVGLRGTSPAAFYGGRPWWLNAMFGGAMLVMALVPLIAGGTVGRTPRG